MASRLTVIFYIVLCLEAGAALSLLPWFPGLFGMADWGDNYFLVLASQKAGLPGLQAAVASGWVRGAVTGLGLLNLAMAFWEMAHFRENVRKLQGDVDNSRAVAAAAPPRAAAQTPADAVPTATPDHLPHHERSDEAGDQPRS